MIGGLVAATHLAVNGARLQSVRGLRRQQQVVDADAVVLGPGAGLIIPERVLVRLGIAGAEGIREAEIDELAQLAAGLDLEKGVVFPGDRIPDIVFRRNDVVVASEDKWFLVAQERACV